MLAATRYGIFVTVYRKRKQYMTEQDLVLSNILSKVKFLFIQRRYGFLVSTNIYHLLFLFKYLKYCMN